MYAAAAAAAKSLQSCPTLCNPTDGSPPGSPVHRKEILESENPGFNPSRLLLDMRSLQTS